MVHDYRRHRRVERALLAGWLRALERTEGTRAVRAPGFGPSVCYGYVCAAFGGDPIVGSQARPLGR